jgi:uncharacterized protein (DUF1499 family)
MLRAMATHIALASLALAAVGALGAHLRALTPLVGFGMIMLAAVGGLVAAVMASVAVARGRDPHILLAIALGLPTFLAAAIPALRGRESPRINDITTDLGDPPAFVAAGNIPYPQRFAPVVREHYPDLEPLVVPASAGATFQRVVGIVHDRDWAVARVDEAAREIEAVATTRLFRFEDDVAVRVRTTADGGACVDVRSRSRDGRGDFGVNAARIRSLLAELRTAASRP